MSFSIDDMRAALSRMVLLVEGDSGNRCDAMKSVARRMGMGERSLRRIIDGTAKLNGPRIAFNIREAYRRTLINKIAELQNELKALERGDEILDVWDFDLQITALQNQLKERKEMLNDGNGRR